MYNWGPMMCYWQMHYFLYHTKVDHKFWMEAALYRGARALRFCIDLIESTSVECVPAIKKVECCWAELSLAW